VQRDRDTLVVVEVVERALEQTDTLMVVEHVRRAGIDPRLVTERARLRVGTLCAAPLAERDASHDPEQP